MNILKNIPILYTLSETRETTFSYNKQPNSLFDLKKFISGSAYWKSRSIKWVQQRQRKIILNSWDFFLLSPSSSTWNKCTRRVGVEREIEILFFELLVANFEVYGWMGSSQPLKKIANLIEFGELSQKLSPIHSSRIKEFLSSQNERQEDYLILTHKVWEHDLQTLLKGD